MGSLVDAPLTEDEYTQTLKKLEAYKNSLPHPDLPVIDDGERAWSVVEELDEIRKRSKKGMDLALSWARALDVRPYIP